MTDSIVRNSTPAVPIANLKFITGYEGERAVENILHAQLNGSGFNVTFKPVRLRSGTLRLLFATAAHAWAAVTVMQGSYTFTLTADVPELSMTFVLRRGELRPRNDPGFTVWLVEVPFQELTP